MSDTNEDQEYSLAPSNSAAKIKARMKEIENAIKAQEDIALADPEYKEITSKKIATLREEYDELKDEQEAIAEASAKEIKNAKEEFIKLISGKHIAYIAVDAKICYVKNVSKTDTLVNLMEWNIDWKKFISMMANEAIRPTRFDGFNEHDVRNCFIKAQKFYSARTASFNDYKWDDKQIFNILQIQKDYWAPINSTEEYDPVFDDLMYSLGGGKQENITHLEKLISFKRLYPEKFKTIPNLNLTGKPGGNGKGLLIAILTSIFNPAGVTVVGGKALTGGFNKQIEGKVITILDDERKDGFPNTELKQVTGNASQNIEGKGIDAYNTDATQNWFIFDNVGLIRLAGGGSAGEDRRWSIIVTELTLLEVLQNKYGITIEEAKAKAEAMSKIFENRIECGKWLAAMIKKHKVDEMQVILPLHGQDYWERLEEQKDQYADIFTQILPIFKKQGIFPARFLSEIVNATLDKKINVTTLDKKFREFLSRAGVKEVDSSKDRYVKLMWKGEQTDRVKGSIYRTVIGRAADITEFEFSDISNNPWAGKNTPLASTTIAIRDYNEETSDFQDQRSTPATPATPATLNSENLSAANFMQNVTKNTVDAASVVNKISAGSGSLDPTPATPAKTPATQAAGPTFLQQQMAKMKEQSKNE